MLLLSHAMQQRLKVFLPYLLQKTCNVRYATP